MTDEFRQAAGRIHDATGYRDVFLVGDTQSIKATYRGLARILHPDRVASDRKAEASAAFDRLSGLYQAASQALQDGRFYESAPLVVFDSQAMRHEVATELRRYFDMTTGYRARSTRGATVTDSIIKVAQGVLLDEKRGWHPHTTWSNTTPDNARRQLEDIQFSGPVTTLGIVRSYTTRHGFGPFVTEDPDLDEPLREYFNGTGPWQGRFRIGHFDPLAHRYALAAIGGVDGLVITGLDRTEQLPEWQCAVGYQVPDVADIGRYFAFDPKGTARNINVGQYGDKVYMTRLTQLLFEAMPRYGAPIDSSAESVTAAIERELETPVVLTSHGPTVNDKRVR